MNFNISSQVIEKILESENVSILALPHSQVPVNTEAVITGWGTVHRHEKNDIVKTSDKLKMLTAQIAKNADCKLYNFCRKQQRMLCVTHPKKTGEKINKVSTGYSYESVMLL